MAKRPRVKGRGREIFLGKEDQTAKQQAVEPAKQQAVEVEKVTFYLPSELSDELDGIRTKLKSKYRREKKVSKSEIVRIALQESFRDWGDELKSFPEGELPSK